MPMTCPVRSWCRATEPERLPVKSPRRASVRVDEEVLMARRSGCILLEQECGRRRRGLWKLPALNGRATAGQLLETRYTITHHRVTLRVFAARGPVRARANESWIARPLLDTIGMPSPYRRALAAVIDEPPKGPRARPRKSQREAPPPRASIR